MGRMAFAGIEVWRASFRLRLRFAHHSATRDRIETFLVGLRTADGGAGYGQALPRLYLTGETLESVLNDIRNRYWPELRKLAIPDDGDRETAF